MSGSYDKAKLIRLVQARHEALISARDANERYRDARDRRRHIENGIMANTGGGNVCREAVAKLMGLSEVEAARLKDEEIDRYVVAIVYGDSTTKSTGIAPSTYREFIQAREHERRLEKLLNEKRAAVERHAIVGGLIEAVRGWGFRFDPELEA